jgi:hypothetical protein
MRSSTLRTVLLVKAIEDADPEGKLLPLEERVRATREAVVPAADAVLGAGGDALPASGLRGRVQRFLARRSTLLLDRLALRHPGVATAERSAQRASWLPSAALVVSLAAGVAMSQVDGGHRINILAYPLLGLVAWNLLVYLVLVIAWIRDVGRRHAGSAAGPARGFARAAFGLARRIGFSGTGSPVLAAALRHFAEDWWRASGNLLTVQAKRTLHLCAAALALGLVAGLYARGVAFEYLAGWESTFLTEADVHALLETFLGPASLVTGIALPTAERLAEIRWVEGRGGESAASWVHLFSATAAIFIMLPRLLLAGAGTLALWRLRLRAPLPAALLGYYRQLVGPQGGGLGLASAQVVPYSYEPAADVKQGIERLLGRAFGAGLPVGFHKGVAYGEEEGFDPAAGAAEGALLVLLFNLAATPEDENHGRLIAGARKVVEGGRAFAFLLVLIDPSGYLERFGADAACGPRLEERMETWRSFCRTHGVDAAFVDLASEHDRTREAALTRAFAGALWSSER